MSGGISQPYPLNLGPCVAGGTGPAAEPRGRVDAADAHVARDDRTLGTGSTGTVEYRRISRLHFLILARARKQGQSFCFLSHVLMLTCVYRGLHVLGPGLHFLKAVYLLSIFPDANMNMSNPLPGTYTIVHLIQGAEQ